MRVCLSVKLFRERFRKSTREVFFLLVRFSKGFGHNFYAGTPPCTHWKPPFYIVFHGGMVDVHPLPQVLAAVVLGCGAHNRFFFVRCYCRYRPASKKCGHTHPWGQSLRIIAFRGGVLLGMRRYHSDKDACYDKRHHLFANIFSELRELLPQYRWKF